MTDTGTTGIDPALVSTYVDALGASDRRAALDLARQLLRDGVPPETLLLDLVCVAQDEVGRRWESGEWNVGREHAATAVSEAVVAEIAHHYEGGSPVGRGLHVVVACVENEWHALPARVVAEVLGFAGHRVAFLGASTPPAQLAQYLHDTGPDAVALSCSVASALPRARRMIEASREAGVPVIVGGSGFGTDDLRARRLGAAAWAPTAAEAVRLLAEWRPMTTPPQPLTHPGADDHAELTLRHDEIVGDVVPALADAGLGDADALHESVGHLLRFLAAALLVDDAGIVEDHVAWRRRIERSHRQVPGRVDAEIAAVTSELDDLPVARAMLGATRDRAAVAAGA